MADRDKRWAPLNPAYRRDVLSLLHRPKIDECRLVSRNFHATVENWPAATKPRMKFKSLTLFDEGGLRIVVNRRRVDNLPMKETYVETGAMRRIQFEKVQSLVRFDECCQPLKTQSRHLVGQPVHADKSPDELVEVKFDSIDAEVFSFRTGNRLSAKGAFGLLHFFHHLQHMAFNKIYVDVCNFNLDIFRLLTEHNPSRPFTLASRHLILGAPCGDLAKMDAITRYIASTQLVCSCCSDQVDQLAELMASSGKQIRRMRVQCVSLNGENIDAIIKRLRDDQACLGRAVPETTLELYSHTFPWPELCEPCEAESVEENEKAEELLKFHLRCTIGADHQQGFRVEIKRLKKLPSVIHWVKISVNAY